MVPPPTGREPVIPIQKAVLLQVACVVFGYHVTLAHRVSGPVLNEKHLVAMHATGNRLVVTDRNKSLTLRNGHSIRVGIRAIYEPDGHWDGSDAPDVTGPWRNRPAVRNTWTVINKDAPVAAAPHRHIRHCLRRCDHPRPVLHRRRARPQRHPLQPLDQQHTAHTIT